jgi:hypothetical protein
VNGGAGGVSYKGDRGAKCFANFAVLGVELGVVEESNIEGKMCADKEPRMARNLHNWVRIDVEGAYHRVDFVGAHRGK